VDDTQMSETYDLEELRAAFPKILETQPEYISLDSIESQYNATNGIYKLLPYYQKLSTESLNLKDSRFIIHKHVITGQWQLTEIYDYFWSRNIKALPVTNENALLNSHVTKSHTIQELKKTILNAKIDIKRKNGSIEYLTAFVDKQRQQLEKQTKIMQELEYTLIQKENDICDLKKKWNQS
jgi:hypothetical protein